MTDDKIDYEGMFKETRVKPIKILTRDHYPDARPKFRRGVWIVEVSIPYSLRHLFNATTIRKTAGKTETDYDRRRRSLTNEIYQEFDKRQAEYNEKLKNNSGRAKFIEQMKEEYGETYTEYKRRAYQELDNQLEYNLLEMIEMFGSKVLPKKSEHKFIKTIQELESKNMSYDKEDIKVISPLNTDVPYEDLEHIKLKMDTVAEFVRDDFTRYTIDQVIAVKEYLRQPTLSFFEDLLVETAKKQNKNIPKFDDPDPDYFWTEPLEGDSEIATQINEIDKHSYTDELPDEYDMVDVQLSSIEASGGEVSPTDKLLNSKQREYFDSQQGRKNRPRMSGAVTMKTLRDDYLGWVEINYKENSQATRNKLRQAYDEFIELMGDLEPKQIDNAMAVEFADAQLERYPARAKKTISNRNWCMGVFCGDYAVVKRLMENNPFYGTKLSKKGRPVVNWLEYTDEDLDVIFNHKWGEQELLLLKLGLSTGCRITELARLTWERIYENNHGFTFISLLDEIKPDGIEKTTVKNRGSKRLVPLHPDFKLPTRTTGRLFDYWLSSTTSDTGAGQAVNPTLDKLVTHPQKQFHSFRSTFTIKLKRTGIDNDMERQITGHSGGDVHADVYGGSAVEDRFGWIKKLDLKWLK